MSSLKLGVIGDGGTKRLGSTSFYYSPTRGYNKGGYPLADGKIANRNITASGPMQQAVTNMVLSRKPEHILNLGDMVYNTGASTLYEENVGRQFNEFMAPYPSPDFIDPEGPYRQVNGNTTWPFDTYNYPNGYPNPTTGKRGGSEDGVNRFWPTIGNHEYYLRTSPQGDTNISRHTDGSTVADVDIKGQTSTPAPRPYVDYFAWLNDPDLANQSGLSVGLADMTGNSGVYYKVSLTGDDTDKDQQSGDNEPLVDIYSLDSMRLIMNRGGKYKQFTDGFGPQQAAKKTDTWNLEYDPTQEPTPDNEGITLGANSTDPQNGWNQFNWLKDELENSNARWRILIGHQPIYGSGDSDGQLDDNVNNPELQRLLNGLPKGSFDAYLNGHAHFYQRILENNDQGIGRGIPFITLGSSGRVLDPANQIKIGQSTYFPTFKKRGKEDTPSNNNLFMGKNNDELKGIAQNGVPYKETGFFPYLLKSDPRSVAISAGRAIKSDNGPIGWQSDYGFGFGGGLILAHSNSLLFKYRQPEIPDPAIADNLKASTRSKALYGWEKLSKTDWQPKDPITGEITSKLAHTAMLRLTFEPADNGQIAAASIHNPGTGYMSGMQGIHSVDFEIRGNDKNTGSELNPHDTAIIRLGFENGSLSKVSIIDNGSGYTNLGQVMQSTKKGWNTVPFTENQVAIVPLNYSLVDTWYESPTSSKYRDSYLIAETEAKTRVVNHRSSKMLEVKIFGKDDHTQRLIDKMAQPSQWTTGYNGRGQQRAYRKAQQGTIAVKDNNGLQISEGALKNGRAFLPISSLPNDQTLELVFGGDPSSSYMVNFRPSSTFFEL